MLARRSSLNHPSVGSIELPLLVPSFSSKGFGFLSTRRGNHKKQYSEVAYELAEFGRYPSRAALISAYDLYFDHFNAPDLPHKADYYLRNTMLVFVDSGGYELTSDFDSTEIKPFGYVPKDGYGLDQYLQVLQSLCSRNRPLPLVVANFDHATRGQPLEVQIQRARSIFARHPKCVTSFIIRPWTRKSVSVDPSDLSDKEIANLAGFDIVGIPEKDLGSNLFERLRRVAILRAQLNEAGISVPIQIWGGLDPLTTPLFCFAGAEVFDGVSWLRYAYTRGLAISRESYLILADIGVTASRTLNHAKASLDNLIVLNKLTIALQQWVDFGGERFDMFELEVSEKLREAYKVMQSSISQLRDGA